MFSARILWIRPDSSRSQTFPETGLGIRSNGKIFSVPLRSEYTEKVIPLLMNARSADVLRS